MTCCGTNAGDDALEPIRVVLFGREFAAHDVRGSGVSAQGPNCLQTLATELLRLGYQPEQSIKLYRGGQYIGSQSLGAAAQQEH